MNPDLHALMAPALEAMTTAARRHPDLIGWEIVGLHRVGEQRLSDGGPGNRLLLRQSRHGIEESTVSVQIYVAPGPETMGTAGTTLDPEGDPLLEQIEALLPAARGGANPRWDLPVPDPSTEAKSPVMLDPAFAADPASHVDALQSEADRVCRDLAGARVESAELYGDQIRRRVLTHTGLDWTEETSEFYFEAAFESSPAKTPYNTQEIHEAVRSLQGRGLELPAFIERGGRAASLLGQTRTAPSRSSAKALLGSEALAQLFHALLGHLDLGAEYYRRPHMKEGDLIHEGPLRGDGLSLRLDPTLDFMAQSAARTRDGLPAEAGDLIGENRVLARTGSHRMARYLGKATPRITGNLVIRTGTRTKPELLSGQDEVFEIEAFSSLLISGDTLTWSSEISRGWHHQNGTSTAIKGGVMSGHIRKNLAAAWFSNCQVSWNRTADAYHTAIGYVGPDHALFTEGVSISGN